MNGVRRSAAAALVLAACLQAGCSGGPDSGTVTGTVSVAGKPLAGGSISFIGADGRPIAAEISPNGTYRVDNVPLGEAIVVVNALPSDEPARHKAIKEQISQPPPAPPPPPFAAKYTDMGSTDLRFTVKAGENKFDADLTK